jgi:hypothetical protein
MSTNPNKKLVKSLLCSNASSLSDKLGEFALDQCISNSMLRDIPIIGTALALYKAGNDYQAYIFTKKVLRFLVETESISREERLHYLDSLEDDEKEKLGDNVLLILDNIQDFNAATYLGRCFSLLMSGELSEFTFYQYTHIITNLTPHLTQQIKFLYQSEFMHGYNHNDMYYLISIGLLEMDMSKLMREGKLPIAQRTDLGLAFYKQIISD